MKKKFSILLTFIFTITLVLFNNPSITYADTKSNDKPVITFNGSGHYFNGMHYIDYQLISDPNFSPEIYFSAYDTEDGDISNLMEFDYTSDLLFPTVTVTDSDGNTSTLTLNYKVVHHFLPRFYIDISKPLVITIGKPYDLLEGVHASYELDGDLSDSVVIEDFKLEPGIHYVNYSCTNSLGLTVSYTREIIVLPNTPPVIEAQNIFVPINEPVDLMKSVTAYDEEDGDITNKVTYTINGDITKAGSYIITYEVIDSDGNITTLDRTIEVLDYIDYNLNVGYFGSYSTSLYGRGLKGSTVRIFAGDTLLAETKVEAWGGFEVSVPNQKRGDKIRVEISKDGYVPYSKYVTVKW